MISMWNGYELDHIFGISLPDIKEVFSDDVWKNILSLMVKSEFWNKNWNYSEAIIYAFSQNGLQLQNKIVRKIPFSNKINWKNKIKMYLKNTEITGYMQYWIGNINKKVGKNLNIYNYSEENIYCGHSLMGMFEGYGIENVENDVKKIFAFPNFTDFKNIEFSKFLSQNNSISIHARRGDYLGVNGYCYNNGYFKRATKYLKKRVPNPVFVFFSDPQSYSWIYNNLIIFGLSTKDNVKFVDWNTEKDNYKDMKLMTLCKHNIITQSSFGWWGSYLNQNKGKITISPKNEIISTHHM